MGEYLRRVGKRLGPQRIGEDLTWDWSGVMKNPKGSSMRAWKAYINRYQAFQDVPFSLSIWLPRLLQDYPLAQFIYVERDGATWYRSMVNYHFRRIFQAAPDFDPTGNVAWSEDLARRADSHRYRGVDLSKFAMIRYGTTPVNPYDRDRLISYHLRHMEQARTLLREVDSIILPFEKLDKPESAERMAMFLGLSQVTPLPHMNSGPE